jgi:hypothetical protein
MRLGTLEVLRKKGAVKRREASDGEFFVPLFFCTGMRISDL